MDSRYIVLKLFVEELGQGVGIDNFEDRKAFQKAVYLGQLSGVDLGYRYSWYLRGPYSTALTRDYFQLNEALEAGDRGYEGRTLTATVRERLRRVRALFTVPDAVKLTKASWLELLASWHFLTQVNRKKAEEAEAIMEEQKPELAPYTEIARRVLGQNNIPG